MVAVYVFFGRTVPEGLITPIKKALNLVMNWFHVFFNAAHFLAK